MRTSIHQGQDVVKTSPPMLPAITNGPVASRPVAPTNQKTYAVVMRTIVEARFDATDVLTALGYAMGDNPQAEVVSISEVAR